MDCLDGFVAIRDLIKFARLIKVITKQKDMKTLIKNGFVIFGKHATDSSLNIRVSKYFQ